MPLGFTSASGGKGFDGGRFFYGGGKTFGCADGRLSGGIGR